MARFQASVLTRCVWLSRKVAAWATVVDGLMELYFGWADGAVPMCNFEIVTSLPPPDEIVTSREPADTKSAGFWFSPQFIQQRLDRIGEMVDPIGAPGK